MSENSPNNHSKEWPMENWGVPDAEHGGTGSASSPETSHHQETGHNTDASNAELALVSAPTPIDSLDVQLAKLRREGGSQADITHAENETLAALTEGVNKVSADNPRAHNQVGIGMSVFNNMLHATLNTKNGRIGPHQSYPEPSIHHARMITETFQNPGDLFKAISEQFANGGGYTQPELDGVAAALYGNRFDAFKQLREQQESESQSTPSSDDPNQPKYPDVGPSTEDFDSTPDTYGRHAATDKSKLQERPWYTPRGGHEGGEGHRAKNETKGDDGESLDRPEQETVRENPDNPTPPDKEKTEREVKADEILRKSSQLRMDIRSTASDYRYNTAMTIAHAKNALSTPKNLILKGRHDRAKNKYERRREKLNSSNWKFVNNFHERRANKAYNKYMRRKGAHESHNAHMKGRIDKVDNAKNQREQAIETKKKELMNKRIAAETRRLERRRAKREQVVIRQEAQRAQRDILRKSRNGGKELSHKEFIEQRDARVGEFTKKLEAKREDLQKKAIDNIKSRNSGGDRLWQY